jgi:hypothetical protein
VTLVDDCLMRNERRKGPPVRLLTAGFMSSPIVPHAYRMWNRGIALSEATRGLWTVQHPAVSEHWNCFTIAQVNNPAVWKLSLY